MRVLSTKNTKEHEEKQLYQGFASCPFVFFVDEKSAVGDRLQYNF